MQLALEEYYSALERLKNGSTTVVPKGTKITNDSVSLEAGRKKGSIKRSRSQFVGLIAAIEAAGELQKQSPAQELGAKLAKFKDDASNYRALYEAALAREQSLAAELFDIKVKLAQINGENVIPIRHARSRKEDDYDQGK